MDQEIFDPRELPVNDFFCQPTNHKSNDCLTDAINCALGFAWFKSRPQVVRFMQHRGNMSYDDACVDKTVLGVPVSTMKKPFYILKELNVTYQLELWKTLTTPNIKNRFDQEIIPAIFGTQETSPSKPLLESNDLQEYLSR